MGKIRLDENTKVTVNLVLLVAVLLWLVTMAFSTGARNTEINDRLSALEASDIQQGADIESMKAASADIKTDLAVIKTDLAWIRSRLEGAPE